MVRKSRRARRAKRFVNTLSNGYKIHPRGDPPSLVTNPWNSIVVQMSLKSKTHGEKLVTQDLHKALLYQIGVEAIINTNMYIRLIKFNAWGKLNSTMYISVFNLNIATGEFIASIEDASTNRFCPKIGYQYPDSVQNFCLESDIEQYGLPILLINNGTNDVLVYFHILWKFAGFSQLEFRDLVPDDMLNTKFRDFVIVDDSNIEESA